jgi:ABC-type transport system involved in cytochrome bd biosynthesis fused ATPase/permease subunit
MINILALIAALALSAVSAYYSVIGLTAIFASAFWPIVIMGGTLEFAKLVTASWLYRNWNQTPFLLKSYLTAAVITLMFITSMGIFGFLSRAHIEQTLALNSGSKDQIAIITNKIEFEKQSITDLDKQIAQIDAAISKMTDRGQAQSSLRAADQQRKQRDAFVKKREEHVKNISKYTEERIGYESSYRKLEAEVGPVKYIAEMVYGKADGDQLETAVRLVILILVGVFDPLAVLLLIGANMGLTNNRLTNNRNDGILTIDEGVFKE